MYRTRVWTMSLFAGFAKSAVEFCAAQLETFVRAQEDALFDVRFPVTSGRFEQLANVGRCGVGGDVEILGVDIEQQVAHAAAYHVGGVVEATQPENHAIIDSS